MVVLLAINGGLGAKDIAEVPVEAVDLDSGWLRFARNTFQTIGEESRDLVAVQAIMGHVPRSYDTSAIYRQRVSDERLRAVVGAVHDWLLSEGTSNEAQ
ncbi:MAG: hypothetical protein EA424_23300 [Planctomycetaceae bacterium]|nr:MAG: hypothetical protein EA424_23300 [Planctomycetaceae bacterium]